MTIPPIPPPIGILMPRPLLPKGELEREDVDLPTLLLFLLSRHFIFHTSFPFQYLNVS